MKIFETPKAAGDGAGMLGAGTAESGQNMWSLMSNPRMTEISRMGRTMVSLATRMKPMATSSTVMAPRPMGS